MSDDLAAIVFPTVAKQSALTRNDISDLRHLATAVVNGLAGLITNDAAVLNAAAALRDKYGLEVVSPEAFKRDEESHQPQETYETTHDESISLVSLEAEDQPVVRSFLLRLSLPDHKIVGDWGVSNVSARTREQWGIWSNDQFIGYMILPVALPDRALTAHIAVKDDHPEATNAARALLNRLSESVSTKRPSEIHLTIARNQASLREVAFAHGFGATANSDRLAKASLSGVITRHNWPKMSADLHRSTKLKLPSTVPNFDHPDQQIRVVRADGNQVYVPLTLLESKLSPVLFCLPNRPAVLTPVRRDYSEHLFGHLPQQSLLPRARVSLYKERHYISGKKTLKHFKRGTLILFYESSKNGGLSAVVAIARVVHAYLRPVELMKKSDLDPSVFFGPDLEEIGSSPIKTVTVFDNLIRFKSPVELKALRELGCGKPHELLTTQAIDDSQLCEIVSRGLDA